MKSKIFLIIICILTSITSFGQNNSELKSGVYEYTNADTLPKSGLVKIDSTSQNPIRLIIGESVTVRRLIVKNNADTIKAHYTINDYNDMGCARTGERGEYLLSLKKTKNNRYKAKTKSIELTIFPIDENKIEVEVLKGTIEHYYSGGQYLHNRLPFLQIKQTLTFVRELSEEDEKTLK